MLNCCSQIHRPWLGSIVDSGIGLSYLPASLCSLAGRYNNPMTELTLSPQSGTTNLAFGRYKPGWRSRGKVYRGINHAGESKKMSISKRKKSLYDMSTHWWSSHTFYISSFLAVFLSVLVTKPQQRWVRQAGLLHPYTGQQSPNMITFSYLSYKRTYDLILLILHKYLVKQPPRRIAQIIYYKFSESIWQGKSINRKRKIIWYLGKGKKNTGHCIAAQTLLKFFTTVKNRLLIYLLSGSNLNKC